MNSRSQSGNFGLLVKKPGSWPSQDVRGTSWCSENLLTLLWTLGRAELPLLSVTGNNVSDFAVNDLRGKTPDGFGGIPWLAGKAEDFGGGPPIKGDLPFGGKPFHDLLDAGARNTVRSVTMERHKALAWVLGGEDDLDAPAPEV